MADYELPDPAYVLGIDVHQWTGVVDWAKARAAGIRFALVKCLHGVNVAPFFRENWDGARRAGLVRGAWSWLYPSRIVSAGRQARRMLDVLGDDRGELPLTIDFEWTWHNGEPANPDTGDLWGWVQPIEAATQRKPMVYSNWGYWTEHGSREARWAEYPGWFANYGTHTPLIPAPWRAWHFWQWTELGRGTDYGVDPAFERGVDLNYWHGTQEELLAFAGLQLPGLQLELENLAVTIAGRYKELRP